jgi:hypothetical protein
LVALVGLLVVSVALCIPGQQGMIKMSRASAKCLAVATLLMLCALPALSAAPEDLIVRLRLSGESSILAPLRACLVDKLS